MNTTDRPRPSRKSALRALPLAIAALAGAGLALPVASGYLAQDPVPDVGYDDTPVLPDQPWRVHDGKRPQPRVVAPGEAGAPPAGVPHDLGRDLRQRRRERIREQVLAEAEAQEATAVIDEDLLNEVSGLVEWPVALAGSFDERFLEVPAECLISSMKANQKYFHLLDDQGKLKPLFITISNIESQDPDQVISGNEKVIRPRLADAAFFYDTDRKHTLASRIPQLESVVFQQQLGTLADKARRSTAIATFIAERIQGDVAHAQRAVALAKCDLVTEMVLEFPELQGIMGRYYAEQDGEPAEVAQALEEQYLPRFASDAIPQSLTGQALALADRLDTLVGIFGIGQRPTGAKDPFALRRASIGVLNILVKGELNLDLRELLQVTADQHQNLPKAEGLVEGLGAVGEVHDVEGELLGLGLRPDLLDEELHGAFPVSLLLVSRVDHEAPEVELGLLPVDGEHHESDGFVTCVDAPIPGLLLEEGLGEGVPVVTDEVLLVLGDL